MQFWGFLVSYYIFTLADPKGASGCSPLLGNFFSGSIFNVEVQDQRSVTMLTISIESNGALEVDAPFRVIFLEKKSFITVIIIMYR